MSNLPPGLLHLRDDGTECGYVALGDPPAVCTKCGWTPLRQERDDLTRENAALYRAADALLERLCSIDNLWDEGDHAAVDAYLVLRASGEGQAS